MRQPIQCTITGSHLPAEHKHLVSLILGCSKSVEKIFLLGATEVYRHTVTIFHNGQPLHRSFSGFYVLVLEEEQNNQQLNRLRDQIESVSHKWIPVTAVAMAIHTFNTWLGEAHLFASWIMEQATVIYDTNKYNLATVKTPNEEVLNCVHSKLMMDAKQKADAFLAGAELYKVRKEYKLAAFMLHQAAEQQLSASLTVNTGLRANTHNIERLLRYNCMWCDALLDIIHPSGDNSERIFSLLQRAYIESRYGNEYKVGYKELEQMETMVKTLLQTLAS